MVTLCGAVLSCTFLLGVSQHHGHKGEPGVSLGTCRAIGDRAQKIQV